MSLTKREENTIRSVYSASARRSPRGVPMAHDELIEALSEHFYLSTWIITPLVHLLPESRHEMTDEELREIYKLASSGRGNIKPVQARARIQKCDVVRS